MFQIIIKCAVFICLIQSIRGNQNCEEIPDEPKPHECCYLPVIIPQNIRAECVKEVRITKANGSLPIDEKNITDELRLAQCIFVKAKATDGESISEDRVKEVAKSAFIKHDDFEEEFEDSLEKCKHRESDMLKDFHRKVQEHKFTYDKSVNPVYALYISCIGSLLVGNCPDDYEIDTDSCQKARDYLEDCYFQYPYPLYVNFNKF